MPLPAPRRAAFPVPLGSRDLLTTTGHFTIRGKRRGNGCAVFLDATVRQKVRANPAAWRTIAVTQRDAVTELRVHSDGGPLVWTAEAHRELTEAFAWVGTDHSTKVVIITGTDDVYCSELDVTSFVSVPWEHIWWE